jgi:hypothetical protein
MKMGILKRVSCQFLMGHREQLDVFFLSLDLHTIKYCILYNIFFIAQKFSPEILVLHNSGNVCEEFKRSAHGSVFYLISKKLLSKLSALVFYSNKNVVRLNTAGPIQENAF